MIFGEKQSKLFKYLKLMRTIPNGVFGSNGNIYCKLISMVVIHQRSGKGRNVFSKLLLKLSPLSSKLPPTVLITEFLNPNNPQVRTESSTKMCDEVNVMGGHFS